MSSKIRFFIVLLLLVALNLVFIQTVNATDKRALTLEDVWKMKGIGEIALSPDGKWIAFSLSEYRMEPDQFNTDIYLVSTRNGMVKRMTTSPKYDGSPVWRSDSKAMAFISERSDSPQIYLIELEGGEARKVSDIPTGVNDFVWSPDGKYFLLTSTVHPDAKNLKESAERDEEIAESTVKVRIIEHLFYRHWNHWRGGKRNHVFLVPVDGDEIRDVTPGNYDTPPISFWLSSSHDFTFSPDGKEIAFVRNEDSVVAISTNNDIFTVSTRGGTINKITENPANDNQPFYSPDGRYIAYHAMARPGFESDQYDLILYDRETGESRNMTEEFDRDVDEIIWSPNSDKIYFNSRNQGRVSIFCIDIRKEEIQEIVHEHTNMDLAISPDGKTLYFKRQAANMPYEIFAYDLDREKIRQLTSLNLELIAELKMNPVEDFWFESFDGEKIHGLLIKPPFFDSHKKYPLVYCIHGGPQGMCGDHFGWYWDNHYINCLQILASSGYVVAMVNFRGSKGYGQEFCDQVSKNWGGGPYKDLMAGLEYILEDFSFIDSEKLAAWGASYGGFMINWVAGKANTHPASKFKCLVSQAGIFDQTSLYGSTEELWFPEWEFAGTPYERPELYEKWSPSRYARNFKIPTLVIHGQKDFRVPVTQGLQMFTALQRMGVPSKLLYFQDEGHITKKPKNEKLLWDTILDWFDKWVNK